MDENSTMHANDELIKPREAMLASARHIATAEHRIKLLLLKYCPPPLRNY
uniref:Uncharacterized protein n=1 Tax=Romanomermis culicivorax TaxID=13658 RepID=A0A915KFB7_ROMCU